MLFLCPFLVPQPEEYHSQGTDSRDCSQNLPALLQHTHFYQNKQELGFTNSRVKMKKMKKTMMKKKKNSKINRRIAIRIRI